MEISAGGQWSRIVAWDLFTLPISIEIVRYMLPHFSHAIGGIMSILPPQKVLPFFE